MTYRKLRIAFSVTCGLACVLLVVLWVRSYWSSDKLYLRMSTTRNVVIQSVNGGVSLDTRLTERPAPSNVVHFTSFSVNDSFGHMDAMWAEFGRRYGMIYFGPKWMLSAPYGFLALFTATCSA